jgi:uncharacterized membrane protein YhiD involved in acid resistance
MTPSPFSRLPGLTLAAVAALAALLLGGPVAVAQESPAPPGTGLFQDTAAPEDGTPWAVNLRKLLEAALALPLAAGLGATLALRPRRRGTPRRSAPIIQTQILLAVIGAVVMLVVGASLARAFGVVGAAGLVRYRAQVKDPKDAGVMLSTLAVGLAAGVGLYMLAFFAALFVMALLWIIESFEPEAQKFFLLKIGTADARKFQSQVETLLRRHRAKYELRTSSEQELSYEVSLPARRSTDAITNSLFQVEGTTAVDWDEEKKKDAQDII